ncbi:hypothetical protein OIU34_24635 [Pararhizobium sp. BT-229]|uniref:hypothetical protein n=1 Tax=Pararhizobium sp. BT-229 TaxID=2986923 RepID=UPI0021F73035|nr:hypothetical protein [Pararhizobium sp. BT-229]MCV9965089.1 hypothetical protein [Pararhizobium sp. BT-229]
MLDYNVARSMCISPIMSALKSNGIGFDEASFLSGLGKGRLLEIGMGIGQEANIEEAARLASLVGMELSIVPETAAIYAFTEIAVHRTAKADMTGYARRVVEMTEKVSDLCIDLRLATELPTGVFERHYGIEEGFMARLADVTRSASTNLQEIFNYLNAFGATLTSFPRKSEYVNYYRAMRATEGELSVLAAAGLKVA